jgi:O-antigen biosynthesis protein
MQSDYAAPFTASTSLVIPTWNGAAFIGPCLHSLRAYTALPVEVIVVDNGSQDGTVEFVRAHAHVHLITNASNLGFAHAVNQGLHAATGQVLLLLNQDIVAQPNWLEPILQRLQQEPNVGIVGSKLLYPDGRVQHAGGHLLMPSWEGVHYTDDNPANAIDFVTGAAFAIRRTCWQAIGNFDENFYPAYFEDVDYCLRARAGGWRVVYEPRSVLTHHESQSRGSDYALAVNYHAQRLRLVLKHRPMNWILETFIPNECQRAHENAAPAWLHALAHVYLQAVRHAWALPQVATHPKIEELVSQFFELRRLVLRRALPDSKL